jgi:hypothetical protein
LRIGISFNSEKKKSAKRDIPILIGRHRIVIGTCLITPLLLLGVFNSQVIGEKCTDTSWEITEISPFSNLEIINLSQDKQKDGKQFNCYTRGIYPHRCSNGSSRVELQDYIPGLLKEVYGCINFKDQNENQYCLEYLETFSKVTHMDDSCTMKKTEVTAVLGLSKSEKVPDPLIFNHTLTIVYVRSEDQQIKY